VGDVANSTQDLIEVNREKLAQTLDSIAATSKEAQALIVSAKPLLNDGKFIENLQQLSANAAEASANLRQVSADLNDPATIASLRETLDSARATFANAKKITADLDELTGDPKLRNNIRNLINGLGGLLSDAPNLETPIKGNTSNSTAKERTRISPSAEIARTKDLPVRSPEIGKQGVLEKIKINSPKPSNSVSKSEPSQLSR
jgi:phospholipid/cholesterol/gamma-HCH transport system substrate-binding protein